ncbi:MAG: dTMP kinase [Planctomycetota bacterium]
MFLVFEGVDGSGKSTQARLLAREFERRSFGVELVREPGGTPLGEELREILLSRSGRTLAPETELFLFMAARSQLVRDRILPALERGRVVISDRFLWSSVVYQGVRAGLPFEEILEMGRVATAGLAPDRTFVIDLDPEVALSRVGNPDRMEASGVEFQRRVREGFLELAGRFRETSVVIDGRGSAEEVFARVLAHCAIPS